MLPRSSLQHGSIIELFHQVKPEMPSPGPATLADQKCTEEAGLLVHVHSRCICHRDEQAVAGSEREQPPLVGGVQRVLGTSGPAGSAACFHQQDGSRVWAHLLGEEQVREMRYVRSAKEWVLQRWREGRNYKFWFHVWVSTTEKRSNQSAVSELSLLMIKKLLNFVLNKSVLGSCLQVSQSYSGPRICLLQDKTNKFQL